MRTISLDINITLIQETATIEETATTEQTTKEDITEEITTYGKTGNETSVELEMTIQQVTNSSNKLNGNSFYLLQISKQLCMPFFCYFLDHILLLKHNWEIKERKKSNFTVNCN